MGEGLLRHIGGPAYEVMSAGTRPASLNPNAVAAMREVGIDISNQRSKSVNEYAGQEFDVILTVCDNARETCPVFPGRGKRLHYSFDDPAAVAPDEQLSSFRRVRDQIQAQLRLWIDDGTI